jgi:hypothetical protein
MVDALVRWQIGKALVGTEKPAPASPKSSGPAVSRLQSLRQQFSNRNRH